MNSKWFYMIIVAYRIYNPVFWFPLRGKQLNHDPTEFVARKEGALSLWSVNYTRSKIPFLCSGTKLQIFKYPPFERTLCIGTYRINIVYQKWNCKQILHIFGKRRLYWYWSTLRFSSGKRQQNHDVAATLMLGQKTKHSNDVSFWS